MPDASNRPSANPESPTPPSGADRPPTGHSQGTIDAAEAARLAGTALGMGRAGLRTAWKKGKEAAAARGVTEETVRQTLDRGRAMAAEHARRRGLGQSGVPQWPGDFSDGRDAPPATSPPRRSDAGDREPIAPAGTRTRSAARTVTTVALSRAPSLAGRRLLGVFPTAAPGAAPIERRLSAFALDLVIFALAFFALVVVLDVAAGAAFGSGSGGDVWLGLSFDDVFRVVTLRELGRAAAGSASGGALLAQLVYLTGLAAYMIGLEARFGATAGKRVLGLRVIPKGRDRGSVGLQRAAIRNACRLYDLLIPLWPLAVLDLIVTLLSPRRQRSGDWFAGTVVIDERDRR